MRLRISSKSWSSRPPQARPAAAVWAFSSSSSANTAGSSRSRSQNHSSVRVSPWASSMVGRRGATGAETGELADPASVEWSMGVEWSKGVAWSMGVA